MATATASNARRFKLSKFILSWYGILIVYAIMTGIFLLLRMEGGNNPIALSIGSLTFRWYGIIITCGVIVASFLAQFLAERRGDDPDHVWRILPVLLIFGIVFARFWYVFNTWEGYKDYFFSIGNPTHAGAIEIWRGGIAIQGAVVGGIVGALLYGFIYNRMQARKGLNRRFSLWRFADFVAPGLVLAQGIGRWGNFMNNEAYGRQTTLPWGIKIPCEYRTSGATPGTDNTLCPNTYLPNGQISTTGIDKDALFHPTFFYESVWNYFTFLVLFFCIMRPKTIERRFKVKLRDGDIFLLYWVIYSIGRFFTEGFRTDSLYFMGNTASLRTAQVLAIGAILVGGFLLFYRHRKPFPASEALSMRLAPVGVGVPAVGVPAVAGGVRGGAAPKNATVTAPGEAAAVPVDRDNDFDEPEDAATAEDTSGAEFDNELTDVAEVEASEVPGSEASTAEIEAASDELETDAARVAPVGTSPDAEDARVEAAPVETPAVEDSSGLGSMDATFEPVAAENQAADIDSGATSTAEPARVETNPVSGVIENVTAPETVEPPVVVSQEAAPEPEGSPTAEVPPPARDTDPKTVDVDLAEPIAPVTAATAPEGAVSEGTAPGTPAAANTIKPKPAKNKRRKQ